MAQDLDIFRYLSFRDYLRDVHAQRKVLLGRYSWERFSEDCGFGKTPYLHLIISGARKLTDKSAKRLVAGLPLRKEYRRYFLSLVTYENAEGVGEKEHAFATLLNIRAEALGSQDDTRQVQYFSEWFHSVIRELVIFPEFRADGEWISHRLGGKISPAQASYSIELLQRLNYIRFDETTQRWLQTDRRVSVRGDVAELAVMQFHQQMLEIARQCLFACAPGQREYAALTMTVSPTEVDRLKSMIKDFSESLASQFGHHVASDHQVVQINLQLFPITASPEDDNG